MLIGITGFIGSGKDTVANMFVERGCVQDSFAAPLKDRQANWRSKKWSLASVVREFSNHRMVDP